MNDDKKVSGLTNYRQGDGFHWEKKNGEQNCWEQEVERGGTFSFNLQLALLPLWIYKHRCFHYSGEEAIYTFSSAFSN